MAILINDHRGKLAGPALYPTGSAVFSIALGDLDGDGDLDLVTTGSGFNGHVTVMRNGGDGTFGGLDVVVANLNGQSVSVLLNERTGAG